MRPDPLYEYEGEMITAYDLAEKLCYRKKNIDRLLRKYTADEVGVLVKAFHEYHNKNLGLLDNEE